MNGRRNFRKNFPNWGQIYEQRFPRFTQFGCNLLSMPEQPPFLRQTHNNEKVRKNICQNTQAAERE